MIIVNIIVSLCGLILSHFLYKWILRKCHKEPSGPWGLPIVGYTPFLKPRAFKGLMQIKCKYPDIAQVDFGQQRMILLNSYETIKEALLTKGDNFAGRQKTLITQALGLGEGIGSSEGAPWKEHRRFALRTLRDFGVGRNQSEQIIQMEIQNLLQLVESEMSEECHRINIMNYLLRSVSNVVCTLTMGEQPGYENEEILQLMHKFRGILNNNMFTTPHFMFPTFFKYISPLLFLVPGSKHVINVLHGVIKFLQGKIDEHEKQFDPTQESRDYIEAFLLEKRKQDSANPGKNFYTAKELQRIVFDLFIAGTDTTSNSLSWGLLYLAVHPAIQMKCHEEIDATIGREKQPTMKDKEQMPYIQAVLDEIQRYASIVPTGVIHRTFQSDTIHGYHIPGDTLIIPFIYGVHHDPRVWENPEEFYPQHFITKNVDGKIKYSPREELIPFLIGKRECPGESLAKMEFFLFFVSILQKYDVSLPDYEDSEIEEILMGTDGPIHSPGHHDLLFHPRH